MPEWLQIFLTILIVLYIPFGAWIATKIMKLEVELAKVNERVKGHEGWIGAIDKTSGEIALKVDKTHSNVVKIAAKLGVDIKE